MLFDRSKRRVGLTQAGKEVLAPLERIVIDTEVVISHTRDLAGLRRGRVSLAVLPSVAAGLLPRALREFTKKNPAIPVQIKDMVTERVIEAVKREDVDFGIGTRVKADRELTTTPLFTDRLSAFVPKNHPLAVRSRIALKELTRHPLVLTHGDSSVREILELTLKKEKLSVIPAFEVSYMSTVVGLVKAGLGIAILPTIAEIMEGSSDVVRIEITNPVLNRNVEIIEKKGRSPSHAAGSLLEILGRTTASF